MGAGVMKKAGGGGRRRRGGKGKHAVMAEINVTPMVDVMLVLLIIFMVAAPMMTVGVPLELPKTAAKAVPTEQEEPLAVSLQLDGTISLMNETVPEPELIDRLKAISAERDSDKVFLRADGGIPYSRVVEVMGALNAGGFANIILVTDPGGPTLTGGSVKTGTPAKTGN
ncbi:cell division and transport-associated protein TolR [Rhodobacter viridis]|uniref:Cell division and transport-associated protein TolR n=1 Tax=Rhodobacter viridis TaxID=1054202 RepID=A0A318TXB8_9RHOB|nr:ExbD/TolR family protein [Rhodobacter viridis]PYF09342.1 cell division and transport-associated protein TolR [Rhodobacter viridis]